ncbi:hypothetical protein [Alteromonas sp. a30]|uniref:hypothetical protein n=1 Tax=Alteromonas sp. a30 TaxID=2730917 RepID=UPI0022824156|nr:hypothetical protein [Alteromonas sp. a30]MCY7296800.1 hypothetical protein [Alteromonas sp. a30]
MRTQISALAVFTTLATMSASVDAGRYFINLSQVAPGIYNGGGQRDLATKSSDNANKTASKENFHASATGYRVKGYHTVEIIWKGAKSRLIDIYREGQLISTTANSGNFIDSLNSKSKGVSYTYEICEANTNHCANLVTFSF